MLESVKDEYAKIYGLKEAKGAIVTDVTAKVAPASTAGLKVGDVIVEFDGKEVANSQDLIGKVSAAEPDKPISIVYLRDSGASLERINSVVKLGERPVRTRDSGDERGKPLKPAEDQKPFGLTLGELTPALAATYRLDNRRGVIVRAINPASYIADVKLSNGGEAFEEGDLIQRINRTQITNLKSFNDAVAKFKPGDAVVMEVLSYTNNERTLQLKVVQFTVQ
jgi:serine protease Do